MVQHEEIHDSPTGWVAKHIQEYIESEWRKGHMRRGATTLLLTTRGRKTGKLRRTALIYGKDGDNYVIVASRGGHEDHPAWYLNLVDNPEVEIQVGADKLNAHAHVAGHEEKERLWPLMTSNWPAYDDYQKTTDREIPLVVLEPSS